MIELALLLKISKLVIANDTGPMHLAIALGTPVVAIFGPTHPGYTGPYGTKNKVVRVDVPCSPCFLKVCPGYGHVCMKEVTVDMVYNAALSYLE